jgi:hypothetical protein
LQFNGIFNNLYLVIKNNLQLPDIKIKRKKKIFKPTEQSTHLLVYYLYTGGAPKFAEQLNGAMSTHARKLCEK